MLASAASWIACPGANHWAAVQDSGGRCLFSSHARVVGLDGFLHLGKAAGVFRNEVPVVQASRALREHTHEGTRSVPDVAEIQNRVAQIGVIRGSATINRAPAVAWRNVICSDWRALADVARSAKITSALESRSTQSGSVYVERHFVPGPCDTILAPL